MKNSDKPAFATDCVVYDKDEDVNTIEKGKRYDGLTKREYFAGLALQGILSNPRCIQSYKEQYEKEETPFDEVLVSEAVNIADELLKQLETQTNK